MQEIIALAEKMPVSPELIDVLLDGAERVCAGAFPCREKRDMFGTPVDVYDIGAAVYLMPGGE